MEIIEWAIIVIEVVVIGYLGSVLGKLIHAVILKGMRFLSKRTALTLDDILLQYIENPLRLSIIVLSVLFMSGIVPNLFVVQAAMMTYGLAILIVLVSYTLSETVGAVLRWYYEISKTRQTQFLDLTLLPFIRKITRIVFITVGSVIALSVIGVEVSGLLTITSIGVLILGLASQESLANIFAGLVLQLDRPAAYGDYVRTLNGDILRLQKIGSRSAKFYDLNGNVVVMSNSEMAKQRLTNLSVLNRGFQTSILAEIPGKVSPERIDEILSQFFKKEFAKKSTSRASPILVEKITKEGYVLSIPITVKDTENFLSIRDKINRVILEECQRVKAHPASAEKE